MSETDEALYRRYRAEDNDADLEALLSRHRDGLLLFLFSFVRSAEDAEELLMDTFARLAVDKPAFDSRHPGSFKSWLYAIGRNNALMHIRHRKMETVSFEEGIPSEADIPDVELLRKERNRKLYQAMAAIKPEYRRALTLLYLEEWSHEEIAEAMGLKLKQVYNLIDRFSEDLDIVISAKVIGMDWLGGFGKMKTRVLSFLSAPQGEEASDGKGGSDRDDCNGHPHIVIGLASGKRVRDGCELDQSRFLAVHEVG